MYKRIFNFKRERKGMNITPDCLRISEFYHPSPIDDLLIEEHDDGSEKSIRYVTDVYLLLNQKRLNQLSLQELSAYFDNLQQRQTSFTDLRKNLTDEQLMQFIKSRYIQTPSELIAWSDYLQSCYGDELAKIQQATQTAGIDAKVENQDTSTSPAE